MNNSRHIHTSERTPVVGRRYAVTHEGELLYEATVCRAEGCWATLRVERPLPGKYESLYHAGDTFDVKTSLYRFEQSPED